jgi:hypothetical protein
MLPHVGVHCSMGASRTEYQTHKNRSLHQAHKSDFAAPTASQMIARRLQ